MIPDCPGSPAASWGVHLTFSAPLLDKTCLIFSVRGSVICVVFAYCIPALFGSARSDNLPTRSDSD